MFVRRRTEDRNLRDLVYSTSSACAAPLNFETESYSSSTGALVDWVNVPTMQAGQIIYACYGSPSISTDQSHPSSTWSNSYAGVWHLNGSVNDSSPTGANLTNSSGTVAYATGNIAQALNLNGATNIYSSSFSRGSALDLTNVTVTLWMKTGTSQASYHGLAVAQGSYAIFDTSNNPTFYDWNTATGHEGSANIEDNNWHFLTLAKSDGVTNGTNLYLDGNVASPQVAGTATRSTTSVDNTFNIGGGTATSSAQLFTDNRGGGGF